MVSVWQWNLQQFTRRIWVPIAIYAGLGVATALVTLAVKPFLPATLPARIGADAVSTILQIMASSMLSVTTFSLSIMTGAFGAAASGATPRATELLKQDGVTQNVLATFTGAFLFSLSGLIGLQTGIYEEAGRLVLFVVTLVVLAAVIWQLVRWIGHLADFGRLADTIARVERAAASSLSDRMARPFLGGRRLSDTAEAEAMRGQPVMPDGCGYLQMIDVAGLQQVASAAGVTLAIAALPGSFLHPAAPLLRILPPGRADAETEAALRRHFVIAPTRNFAQDPRFGILALTEIASRALSPAVNDPGTAIDILTRQMRLMALWQGRAEAPVDYPALLVPPLRLSDLMTDAFAAIARDGAGLIEVQIRLHKTLAGLADLDPAIFLAEARRLSARALAQAEAAPLLEEDKAVLRALAAEIAARPEGGATARSA